MDISRLRKHTLVADEDVRVSVVPGNGKLPLERADLADGEVCAVGSRRRGRTVWRLRQG